MSSVRRRSVVPAAAAVAYLLLCPALARTNPILLINPSSQAVAIGEVFTADIDVSDVTDLYSFQFDLAFDPAVLSAIDITEGSFLATGGPTFFIPGTIDNVAGTVTFTANSLLGEIPGVSGSGTLAQLGLLAIGAGNSPLILSEIILLDSSLASVDYTAQSGDFTVVPEPSTLALLASGLAATAMRRRRKRLMRTCATRQVME